MNHVSTGKLLVTSIAVNPKYLMSIGIADRRDIAMSRPSSSLCRQLSSLTTASASRSHPLRSFPSPSPSSSASRPSLRCRRPDACQSLRGATYDVARLFHTSSCGWTCSFNSGRTRLTMLQYNGMAKSPVQSLEQGASHLEPARIHFR